MSNRRQRIDSTASLIEQHKHAQEMEIILPDPEYAIGYFGSRLWSGLSQTRLARDWLPADLALLAKACALEDQIQEMDELVRKEGFMVSKGPGKGTMPHPLLAEVDRVRRTQSAYLRTLRLHAAKTEPLNNLGKAVLNLKAEHYAD